jgi:membrane fusion protein (multidrug efflux system)
VLVVDGEDRVQAQRVEVGTQRAGYLEVKDGLEAGARVIVEGIQKARPGNRVTVSLVNTDN